MNTKTTSTKDDKIANHLHRKEARYALIIAAFCNRYCMQQSALNAEQVYENINEDFKDYTDISEINDSLEIFHLSGGSMKYVDNDKPITYRPVTKENFDN